MAQTNVYYPTIYSRAIRLPSGISSWNQPHHAVRQANPAVFLQVIIDMSFHRHHLQNVALQQLCQDDSEDDIGDMFAQALSGPEPESPQVVSLGL
jgi:hypothetical protein